MATLNLSSPPVSLHISPSSPSPLVTVKVLPSNKIVFKKVLYPMSNRLLINLVPILSSYFDFDNWSSNTISYGIYLDSSSTPIDSGTFTYSF